MRTRGESWIAGETISLSIGQGANLTTPIQLAVAYAAIANGGRIVQPRIVLRRETVLREYVLDFIHKFAPHLARQDITRALTEPTPRYWPQVPHWRERNLADISASA